MLTATAIDGLIIALERGVKAAITPPRGTGRKNPAKDLKDPVPLNDEERRHAAGLMRVNHTGEIAAQALYHGQAVFARDQEVIQRLKISALEEEDHLIWCAQRVKALGSQTSKLEPLWYWGSFTIGLIASATGDKWSLGFIKETEDQVIAHLQKHLTELPKNDSVSRTIINQMIIDEGEHGDAAVAAGGVPLPLPVKKVMKLTAKVMTSLSYRI